MKTTLVIRRGLVWTAASLSAVIAIVVGLCAALDAGYFRGPLIRFLAAHAGREIQIDGSIETHLLSLTPRASAERVTIGNPPWTPPGRAAELEKLSLVFHLPGFGHSFGIQRLEMQGAKLHLIRDSAGHANWQTDDPDKGPQSGLPLIRSLSMPHARVDLEDALRHLRFEGTVTAQDSEGAKGLRPLRIAGEGELNGRADSFEITSDPLAAASRARPYGFDFTERSSGSVLTGGGALLHAFDFDAIDAKFEAAGEDLQDLFFLTGVTLVNTGSYRLSGHVSRRGTHTVFSNLAVTSAQSDVLAKVSLDTSSGRTRFEADFSSRVIRLSDLGVRAAGREYDPESDKLLLSNAMLSPRAVRRGDWTVRFNADRVDVGHLSLHAVSGKMTIERGVLVVAPLSADVLGGKLGAHLRLDAKTDTPKADVDLKLTDVQLARLDRKGAGPPPLEGSLQGRVKVTGDGRSIHEIAASANGQVTAVVAHGDIRASLAELTGIDLRAFGLLLSKNERATELRCLVASFEAHEGTLNTQRLVVDTDPVLITGEGRLELDTESLDFALSGRPKSGRLFRLRTPVVVRGTLAHPIVGVRARNVVAQTAEAVALGVVLTPLAALLAFIDPGLAKNADCDALQEHATVAGR